MKAYEITFFSIKCSNITWHKVMKSVSSVLLCHQHIKSAILYHMMYLYHKRETFDGLNFHGFQAYRKSFPMNF